MNRDERAGTYGIPPEWLSRMRLLFRESYPSAGARLLDAFPLFSLSL